MKEIIKGNGSFLDDQDLYLGIKVGVWREWRNTAIQKLLIEMEKARGDKLNPLYS